VRGTAELQVRTFLSKRSALSIALIAAAAILGGFGAFVLLTERGVANEIKGFVLVLIAAVLLVGGCMLWELRAIRRVLEDQNSK
jgi:peptidoglycan/LPS O-acetylase OafA/YrhL